MKNTPNGCTKGIHVDKQTLILDVIPLVARRKNNSEYRTEIISEITYITSNFDIKEICVFVGKSFSISMFERESILLKKLMNYFYNADLDIQKCYIYNIPSTFSLMFRVIKPFMTARAMSIIKFDNKTYESWSQDKSLAYMN